MHEGKWVGTWEITVSQSIKVNDMLLVALQGQWVYIRQQYHSAWG